MTLMVLMFVGCLFQLFTRTGMNVYSWYWSIFVSAFYCYWAGAGTLSVLSEADDLDHQWDEDNIIVNYTMMAYCIMFTLCAFGYAAIMFQITMPETLTRRHYNFRCEHRLLSCARCPPAPC